MRAQTESTHALDPLSGQERPGGDAEGVPGEVGRERLAVPEAGEPLAGEQAVNDERERLRRAAGGLGAAKVEAVDGERRQEDEDGREEVAAELERRASRERGAGARSAFVEQQGRRQQIGEREGRPSPAPLLPDGFVVGGCVA